MLHIHLDWTKPLMPSEYINIATGWILHNPNEIIILGSFQTIHVAMETIEILCLTSETRLKWTP